MPSYPISAVDKGSVHSFRVTYGRPNRHRFIMAVRAEGLVVALGAHIFCALGLDTVAGKESVSVGIDIFGFFRVEVETLVAHFAPARIQVRFVTGGAIGMPESGLFFSIKVRPVGGSFVTLLTSGAVSSGVGHVGKEKVTVLWLSGASSVRISVARGAAILLFHLMALRTLGFGWDRRCRVLLVEKRSVTIFAGEVLFRVHVVRKNDCVRFFNGDY